MVGPITSTPSQGVESVNDAASLESARAPMQSRAGDTDWFLPGNDGNHSEIKAEANAAVGSMTPDSLASGILAYIGR